MSSLAFILGVALRVAGLSVGVSGCRNGVLVLLTMDVCMLCPKRRQGVSSAVESPDDGLVLSISAAWSCTLELPLVAGRAHKTGCKYEHKFPMPAHG